MSLIGENLDLDFTDLDFSLIETIDSSSSVYQNDLSNFSNFHQPATVSLDSSTKLSFVLAQEHHQHQTDFIDNLDFELTDHSFLNVQLYQNNDVFSSLEQLNSPSNEVTYGNVNSLDSSNEDNISMLPSPASSISDESSFEKPKIRKTRARVIDKKESNKAAAIRYRNKKLKEKDQLFTECEEYAKKIEEMRQKVADTQNEISYIKSLLVEALVIKSGLKS
ncbi:cyclic AMP-dependent transcription factor ATF-4 [Brachionus plicatilis]|uniref:Cyclic AMP-dependent transcription factor ATF-4 n=1 Tax=Brachionus plicatilis TaxID=10195 RepID=A0A3M7SE89_BRAPC|nr:cyclic AMP-dependent transcription factor ATF-4 [Brachionus plicatilis]